MKKIGDRKDARRVREIDGLHNIMIDLKPRRCDSDVYINQTMDVTNLVKYIEKFKKDNPDNKLTYFHAFSIAFAKVLYNRPLLNRFICNRVTYERNDIILAFVAKIAFDDESEEVMINIKVDKKDTIFDIRDKIKTKVDKIRNAKNKNNNKENTNNVVEKVGKLPKIIRIPLVGTLKWMDQKGWLPASMVEDNLYYSSVILSNLGNLGIGSIYHNITNFGTSSIIITIGKIHKEKIIDENGKEIIIDACDFGMNCDERISDGYYFAKSMKLFEYILSNPKLLEGASNEKIEIK